MLKYTVDIAIKVSASLSIIVPLVVGEAKPVKNPQDEKICEKA